MKKTILSSNLPSRKQDSRRRPSGGVVMTGKPIPSGPLAYIAKYATGEFQLPPWMK